MPDIRIMKAVEYKKLPAKFKKQHPNVLAMRAAGWAIQPKYDGCYAEFHILDDRTVRALTRTGETIRSCDHIAQYLLTVSEEPCVWVGELWDMDREALFPKISGDVRRHSASPNLTLMVFDLLPPGMETARPYRTRYHEYHRLLPSTKIPRVVEAVHCMQDSRSPEDIAISLKDTGKFDGAIMRCMNSPYTVGLVKNGEVVKVKPVLSLDLIVTDFYTEQGEKTGRDVYSIEVVCDGVRSKVGSGIPHSRTECPQIGDIVEIECMGMTADGKLREPRFKGIRFDKEQPD
jgi:ATP-dependent DNA ligase